MLFSTLATNCVSGSALPAGRDVVRVWLGATWPVPSVTPVSRKRIDAQDQRDHDDRDQAKATAKQAAAQRDADARPAKAAANTTAAESTAFAAAILDVAALVAIRLHDSVSVV